jgi:hypothetical protein
MARVYLEPSALALAGVSDVPVGVVDGHDALEVIAPGALEGVAHLREAGHEAIILAEGTGSRQTFEGLVSPPVSVETRLPDSPPPGTWLVTGDPERCAHRPAGVRTILVGPRRPPTHRPTARCDLEARDVAAAVLEILADEAM